MPGQRAMHRAKKVPSMTLEVIYSVRLHPGLISLAYAADKYCAGLEQANRICF